MRHDDESAIPGDEFKQELTSMEDEKYKMVISRQWVCFLIDGAEFIVRQDWATDAWAYLRGLKDTDTAIKPVLGLLLSGYRDLKEYQQRVGSPLLNIAEIQWLAALSDEDTKKLIGDRAEQEKISLSEEKITSIIEWSGCHPYLTQQSLNIIFDSNHQQESRANLIDKLLQHHDNDFSAWWNAEHLSGCFGEVERTVYCAMIQNRQATPKSLAQCTGFNRVQVTDALEVIAGTGVIRQLDEECYTLGSRLFEEWVTQQDITNLKSSHP